MNARPTSARLNGIPARSGRPCSRRASIDCSRTSATASPRSDERSYASDRASAGRSARPATAPAIAGPAEPGGPLSISGNGRPVRKTAATGSSSGSSVREVGRRRIAVFSEVFVVAETRSATSLQRRMAAMVYGPPRCSTALVPGPIEGDRVVLRRHVRGQPGRVPALVRGSRGRPPDPLPGRPDALERDRAVLPGARPRLRLAGDGDPRCERPTGSSASCAFSQLDGDNGSALFHITIGEHDAWGQGYGTRGDPPDGRPRLRAAPACTGSALSRVRVQRAGDPLVSASRLRDRGSGARGDLARRTLVGRGPDEHPREPTGGRWRPRRRQPPDGPAEGRSARRTTRSH